MEYDYKIAIPTPKDNFILRDKVSSKILDNLHRKLTFISAPAGYGKTTIAAEVCTLTEASISWISLDTSDRSIHTFSRSLYKSLQHATKKFPDDIEDVTPDEDIWGYIGLLNEGLQKMRDKHILVLDNYEVVEDLSEIDSLVNFLLQQSPPHLHIIICSRTQTNLSLAGLVVNQEIYIVTKKNLLLDFAEAKAIATKSKYADTVLEEAFSSSRGWIAAFTLFLQHPPKTSAFAEDLLDQYIYQELISHLTEEEESLLLHTLPLKTFTEEDLYRLPITSRDSLPSLLTKYQILDKSKTNGQIIFSYQNYLAKTIEKYFRSHMSQEWTSACKRLISILDNKDIRKFRLYIDSNDSELLGNIIQINLKKWIETDFFLFNHGYIAENISESTSNIYCQLVYAESILKNQPAKAIRKFNHILSQNPKDSTIIDLATVGLIRAYFYNKDYQILINWKYDSNSLSIYNQAISQNFLARAYMSMELYDQASTCFNIVKDIALQENNEYLEILAIRGLAAHADHIGNCQKAVELNIKALSYWQRRGNWLEIIRTTNNLASSYYSLGHLERALNIIQPALEKLEEYDLGKIFSLIYCTSGDIYLSKRFLKKARASYLDAQKGGNFVQIYALTGLARISLQEKKMSTAREFANEALTRSKATGITFTHAFALLILGLIEYFEGDEESCWVHLNQALDLYKSLKLFREEAKTLQVMKSCNPFRFKKESLQNLLDQVVLELQFTPQTNDLLLPESTSFLCDQKLLRLKTFGEIRIDLNGDSILIEEFNGQKPFELFLYFVFANTNRTKYQIIDDIWGEDTNGTSQISVALSRVRKALKDKDSILLRSGGYRFNDTYHVDEDGLKIMQIEPESITSDDISFLSQVELSEYLPSLYSEWALNWKRIVESQIIFITQYLCDKRKSEYKLLYNLVNYSLKIEPENPIFHKWLISYYLSRGQRTRAHDQVNMYKDSVAAFGIGEDITVQDALK